MARKTRRLPRRREALTARTADRHDLYERSVQNPEADIDFIDRVCRRETGQVASLLREDFCGTFAASREWVRRRRTNRVHAVDLDASVLEWGRRRASERLDAEQRSRIALHLADVRSVRLPPVDVAIAFNFSYFIFKEREMLRSYLRRLHAGIRPGGLLMLDAYGGSDAFREMEEERALDGFVYVWDQHAYSPITGEVVNHITFRFPDGSEMRRAFTYDWRLWTLPEIQELAVEAGFETPVVYWEGTEKDGTGNGVFRPSRKGEACEGWVAYIVARRG